ncbi:MAG TPA: S8 family serine peptidase, partial [Candidatus Saccharimonadales bacterium]|nr:S8 family serine peptidase [Candidatus Saccharimonadales bacterium]
MKKAALILLLALAQDLCGQNTHKLQVTDPDQAARVVAAGGRLIADYGSYRLFEVPAAALNRNWGQARDDYNLILLNAAHLDTTRQEVQALRRSAGNFAGKRLHLIQFAGPVQPGWRQELLDAGVQIVSYIPQNTYLVYGDSHSIAQLQALAATAPHIQWEGAYLDDYKTHPAARAGRTDRFAIQLAADAQANAQTLKVVDGLKLAPMAQPHRVLGYLNIVARLRAADLALVAARSDVVSIQPWFPPKKNCERQDQIVAGNLNGDVPAGPGYLAWLAGKGFADEQFAASGFVVDITDSGIDDGTTAPNHFGLYASGQTNAASRVVYSRLEGTPNSPSTLKGCDGHGTLNAHIVGGFDSGTNFPFADSFGYAYGLGVCPFARLGASVVFDPDDWTNPSLSQLEADAYNSGARVNNNSWGDGDDDGIYGGDSQEYDALVRDAQPAGTTYPTPGNQEMVIVFAAGNAGPADQTMDQPGTAKNVITVGGADNVQLFGGEDGCGIGDDQADSANEILTLSSRGPCADGRLKPDLMAPATHVSGGVVQAPDPGPFGTADACYNAYSVCGGVGNMFYPSFQEFYTASSGTSHSTPCVAGVSPP